MKLSSSSKPMSSPGRTEKYPPPLMRFMRSNVGSRSRGRSRSSPMFVRKKNTAIETQEPSSPKVTCIGQVRVRRSKQKGSKAGRNRAPGRRRCRWAASVLFCRNFHGKLKHKSFRPCFRKWVLFFQVGFRRKAEVREKSCKFETKFQEKEDDIIRRYKQSYKEEDDEEDEEEEAQNLMYPSSTPPKNAFLLTRCRSAPYRSSSLASRFWGSPLVTEETGEEEEEAPQKTELENREQQQSQQRQQHIENDEPTSESEPSCRDSAAESRTDPESEESMGLCYSSKEDEFEGSVNNTNNNDVEIEGLKKTGEEEEVCSVRPPVILLTRCKSEPASRTTSEKLLHPETIFWRKQNV